MNKLFKTMLKECKKTLKNFYLLYSKFRGKNIIYNYKEYLENKETPKRALLSYLVDPLHHPPNKRNRTMFSNLGIAQYIPRALNELGFIVDIANYDDIKFVPKKRYDLFIGHGGYNFENVASKLSLEIPRIYFSTGIYWKTWNAREKERFDALLKRRGVKLPFDRFISASEEYANRQADGIICLGNEYARQTYKDFPLVLNINNAVFPVEYNVKFKDFKYGRNHFLFFSGSGNVHKGLDLLLEAFSKLNKHLYICQLIEPEFDKIYKKELYGYPNIHFIGFIKLRSKKFYELASKCNFVIHPTCAEGQPGSVLECMAHGLIPILSKEAKTDVKNFGVILKENTIEEITNVVNEISQKPIEWFKEKSELVLKEIAENYTPERFLENMKNAIQTIIQVKKQKIN